MSSRRRASSSAFTSKPPNKAVHVRAWLPAQRKNRVSKSWASLFQVEFGNFSSRTVDTRAWPDMASKYPTSIDTFTNPNPGDSLSSPSHAAQHDLANDAILALQNYVGTSSSTGFQRKLTFGGYVLPTTTATYNQGTVLSYNGQTILITNSSGATCTSGFISSANYSVISGTDGWYDASRYGFSGSDIGLALNQLIGLVSSKGGGNIRIPPGTWYTSIPIIMQSGVHLWGPNMSAYCEIRATQTANCDVVRFYTNSSAWSSSTAYTANTTVTSDGYLYVALAAVTGGSGPGLDTTNWKQIMPTSYVSNSSSSGFGSTSALQQNAFYCGLWNLQINGNSYGSTAMTADQFWHGINHTTLPATTQATYDAGFDPHHIICNVQVTNTRGHGVYMSGRSGTRFIGTYVHSAGGHGYSITFDTAFDSCYAEGNGLAGWYVNNSSGINVGSKSYNNGKTAAWVTGQSYNYLDRVIDTTSSATDSTSWGLYVCINSAGITSTTAPSSDSTNWTLLTSATGAGNGWYFGSNAEEHALAGCEAQQNAGNGFRLVGSKSINISGTVGTPNTGLGTAGSSAISTNDNYFAAVSLSSATGCIIDVTSYLLGTSGYVLRLQTGCARNSIRVSSDLTGTFGAPDNITIAASTNNVMFNGSNLTNTLALQNDVSITSPAAGQVLAYNGTSWANTSASSSFYANLFGNGTGGVVTLDGTTTYSGFTLSGSTYTLNATGVKAPPSTLTINSGVTLNTAGYPLQVAGTLTNNGTITNAGGNASGSSAGTKAGNGTYGSYALGNGGTTTGSVGTSSTSRAAGAGGAGGLGSSGSGGAGGSVGSTNSTQYYANPTPVLLGQVTASGALYLIAGGGAGGGGGGDGTNAGGGGGAGGGVLAIFAQSLVNNGVMTVAGGNGATPTTGNCGGGGGGGGGTILAYTLTAVTGTGSTTLTGGTGGSGVGTGVAGTAGGTGTYYATTVL